MNVQREIQTTADNKSDDSWTERVQGDHAHGGVDCKLGHGRVMAPLSFVVEVVFIGNQP